MTVSVQNLIALLAHWISEEVICDAEISAGINHYHLLMAGEKVSMAPYQTWFAMHQVLNRH